MVDFDDRECTTEAILLLATFFALKNPFQDIWLRKKKIKISAHSTASWKRPKASSLGLKQILDYDETYEFFHNATPEEFQKQSTTRKQWAGRTISNNNDKSKL